MGRERTKTFTYDFSYFSAEAKSSNYASQEMVGKWIHKILFQDKKAMFSCTIKGVTVEKILSAAVALGFHNTVYYCITVYYER